MVKLAKANVIAFKQCEPSTEIALDVRQKLLGLLDIRQYVL